MNPSKHCTQHDSCQHIRQNNTAAINYKLTISLGGGAYENVVDAAMWLMYVGIGLITESTRKVK